MGNDKESAAEVSFDQGALHLNSGQKDEAIAAYSHAIKLNPKYAEAYYNRGIVYGLKGQFDRAIEDFTKAIALQPDYADAYNNSACVHLYKSIPNFEERNGVQRQEDIAAILRP